MSWPVAGRWPPSAPPPRSRPRSGCAPGGSRVRCALWPSVPVWAWAPPRRLTPAGSPVRPFGLTPRERQVLALIAEGATNRQIGESLFMAEKTASVHVSRILAKLGVKGRTQAAAVAHRRHLA